MNRSGNDRTNELYEMIREMMGEMYNPPPSTPTEEIWARVARELPVSEGQEPSRAPDLDRARQRRRSKKGWKYARILAWTGAAAALLILGIAIGQTLGPVMGPATPEAAWTGPTPAAGQSPLRKATMDHLARTEALLTVVKTDGRSGSLDPAVGPWARGLLTETRLFLDAPGVTDPALEELMKDLELILAQIVGLARTGGGDESRLRTELDLALESLTKQKIMTRLQATS